MKKKTKKQMGDDMKKLEKMTWEIVKLPNGSYRWILIPRGK